MVANVSALGCAVLVVFNEDASISIPRVALDRCTLLVGLSIIHIVVENDYSLGVVFEDVVVNYATLWWSREE